MNTKMLDAVLENPEIAKVMMKEVVAQYKPLLYSVLGELFEVYKDYANNTEYFKTSAKVRRNQFEALINAGFTEEQAMVIMIDNIERTKKYFKDYNDNLKQNINKK